MLQWSVIEAWTWQVLVGKNYRRLGLVKTKPSALCKHRLTSKEL